MRNHLSILLVLWVWADYQLNSKLCKLWCLHQIHYIFNQLYLCLLEKPDLLTQWSLIESYSKIKIWIFHLVIFGWIEIFCFFYDETKQHFFSATVGAAKWKNTLVKPWEEQQMFFSAFFMLYIYPPTLRKKPIHFPSCHKSPFKWLLQSIATFSKNMSKLLHQLWSRNPKLEKHSSTDGSWCRIFSFKRKTNKMHFRNCKWKKWYKSELTNQL